MAVENTTILIALMVAIIIGIVWRASKIISILVLMGVGVYTLSVSAGTTDPTAYGLLGWIILAGAFALLVDWLFGKINTKKKRNR